MKLTTTHLLLQKSLISFGGHLKQCYSSYPSSSAEKDGLRFLEEEVHDAWMSPTTVELKIPTAIAKARRMQAEGRTLVTRERSTSSTLIPPFPAHYVKVAESIPMVPDPVLRDYLNESLTYSEYRFLANLWQKYTEQKHPSSRDLHSVMAGHDLNIHAKSAQLSFFFFFFNFGCLLRQPGVGSRKMAWLSTTHPDAPRMSYIFSFGHETGDISEQHAKDPVIRDNLAETPGYTSFFLQL